MTVQMLDRTLPDRRLPEWRRDTFLDFYLFHLKHRAHPGAVYYLVPYLRDTLGWDDEETLWYCVINGNTQNPVTSWILHRQAPRPKYLPRLLRYWRAFREQLAWDTDRRYHRTQLDRSLESYLAMMRPEMATSQVEYWGARSGDWANVWRSATQIETFGRLSAWSYAEYLYIAGYGADADTLLVGEEGSNSHTNGLSLLDGYDWERAPYRKLASYDRAEVDRLTALGEDLLEEARARSAKHPVQTLEWPTRLTLESALCTYKSWHKPNRRYPNVYNDMLYERIRAAQAIWTGLDFGIFWEAREKHLPPHLRLESTPTDPGRVPAKQNHYRETGHPVVMYAGTAEASAFDLDVEAGAMGTFR